MKKMAFVLLLTLAFQLIAKVSYAVPVFPGGGGVVVLFAELFGSTPNKESAIPKKGLNEFAALNNNTGFLSLLKQTAGGSSNTLDILK